MSTNTGVAPTLWIVPAVAKKVNGVVITSSPGPASTARNASRSASVPLAHAHRVRRMRQLRHLALQPLHGRAKDEQLGVHELEQHLHDVVLDRRVLGAQVQQGNGHGQIGQCPETGP